jgi:hypothetical protein
MSGVAVHRVAEVFRLADAAGHVRRDRPAELDCAGE